MMKKINSVSLLLLLIAMSNKAEGREVVTRDPFKDIEMTQRLLELRRQQEYIDQQLKYPTRNDDIQKEEKKFEIEDGKKFTFKTIKVQGSDMYHGEIRKILEQYAGKKLGKSEIYELLSELSNVYLKKGYLTTVVTIKSGNVNEGILIFEVKEGKFNEVKYLNKDMSLLDKLKVKMAFPIKKDELLTSKAMDQGIENMNIGGRNNVIEVSATENYGYSDLVIEENFSPSGFSIGMDNSAYEDKGRKKVNLNFSQTNLLGINDKLTLNYIERLTKNKDFDKESNYDLGYSFPVGYWTFGYNYNLGDNFNTTVSDLGEYKSESKSQKHKFKISRILSRGEQHKTTLHGTLILKDNHNTMNGLVLDVSTKKYTNATIGIDHTDRFLGGTIFGMIEYERGLPWFGAEGDPSISKTGDFKIEYNKINFNLDWMRPFFIKDHGFQYRMGMGGSYSDDRLLSANQFTMGDEFTVRGFKESSVAGNKGVYVNNTLTYMGPKNNMLFSIVQPFIGLDGGVSRDRDLPTSDKIAGFVVGFKANYKNVNTSLTYGVPLKWAEGMPKEDNPIYFNLNYRI